MTRHSVDVLLVGTFNNEQEVYSMPFTNKCDQTEQKPIAL